MTLSDDEIFEDDSVTATCSSTGGVPESVYVYSELSVIQFDLTSRPDKMAPYRSKV